MPEKKDRREKLKMKKIEFFSDQPLTADKEQEVRFGHLDIADNLRQVVSNCPLPFTVGLFGKWGSGKTTILNMLRARLQNDEIGIVNFDVWKHEGDALRRTFLIESVEQLKEANYLPSKFELNEKLEKQIRKIFENRIQWNKLVYIVLILIAIAIGGWFIIRRLWPYRLGVYSSIVFGGGLVSSALLLMLQHIVSKETLTEVFDRFTDPHEFETEFKRIVRTANCKKLLFIIDNLDRCTREKAVELLSTVKTFLAKEMDTGKQNKSLFLIACDDAAIKEHIQGVYRIQEEEKEKKSFSADEFLRKFFNISLRIPDFIDTELQTYTEDLLEKTGIPQFDSPDLAYVMTAAFRDNPRHVKQFINTLIAHFLLAQEREKAKPPLIMPKGTITDNVAFLAKFLIIRQQYFRDCQEIIEKHFDFEQLEHETKNPGCKNFLRVTRPITAPNIRPFIYLKQSEEQRAIPEIEELETALIDGNQEIVRQRLKIIKEKPEQTESLKKVMPSLIDENSGRNIPLLHIISCSLDALQSYGIELNRDFYRKIADQLNDETFLVASLPDIKPSLVFKEVLPRCSYLDKSGIITKYIGILGKEKSEISEDQTCAIFEALSKHKTWLNNNQKQDLRKHLENTYYSSVKILSLFKKEEKEFISQETISKFIGTFSNDDVENKEDLEAKIDLLLELKGIATPPMVQGIVKKMDELLKNENAKPYREQKENLLNRIEDILDIFYEQIINVPEPSIVSAFASNAIVGINGLGDSTQKKIFVFTCVELTDLLKDQAVKSNVDSVVRDFFNNADVDSIKFVFDKFDKEWKEKLIKRYSEIFSARVPQQPAILDFLYHISPQDIRIQWLINLIDSSPVPATHKLRDLNYKVDDKSRVVEALLTKVEGIPFQDRGALYEAINKMRCANDAELRNRLASQIKSLLSGTDQNLQKVGYDALQGATHLSERVKREITREIVESFRLLEPANANQPHSVRSITINWDILESPVQREYIDFVANKLILRASDINNIRLGFEMLSMTTAKYEDYNMYFDDIFARAEGEGDSQIKTEIKNGLLKLKPSVLNKKNGEFWRKVEKL